MLSDTKEKLIIFSAPSGSGKTTVVHHLLNMFDQLAFSVSATTRPPREGEEDGVDYYFMSEDEFRKRMDNDEFLEYEEVYEGLFYGTLKSEVQRLWDEGKVVLFDVDVKGGINIKKYYGNKALSVFLKPPSIEELMKRLRKRETEVEHRLQERVNKARSELTYEKEFDIVLVNDDLTHTFTTAESIVRYVLRS